MKTILMSLESPPTLSETQKAISAWSTFSLDLRFGLINVSWISFPKMETSFTRDSDKGAILLTSPRMATCFPLTLMPSKAKKRFVSSETSSSKSELIAVQVCLATE